MTRTASHSPAVPDPDRFTPWLSVPAEAPAARSVTRKNTLSHAAPRCLKAPSRAISGIKKTTFRVRQLGRDGFVQGNPIPTAGPADGPLEGRPRGLLLVRPLQARRP